MTYLWWEIAKLLGLPLIVYLSGAWLIDQLSNQKCVRELLRLDQGISSPKDRIPLNLRFFGYETSEVKIYWGVFNTDAIKSEKRFLNLDLLFPPLYGSALIHSIFSAWAHLGKPLSLLWLISPVAITWLADWAENLVLIRQFYRFNHSLDLQDAWIKVASIATQIKLFSSIVSVLLLIGLVGKWAMRSMG